MTFSHLKGIQRLKHHEFDIYDYRLKLLGYDSVIIRLGLISSSLIILK